LDQVLNILKQYWGYDGFLPLQNEAMRRVLNGRDSLVVLPTGGGKSLCFQAPALVNNGMAVVISPLISLMKDQVDALTECGVPAACINSVMSSDEKRAVNRKMRNRSLKLLYISPERLVSEVFIEYLKELELSFIAIDEAHCISAWGHDFRPEYRMLGILKEAFPGVAVHGYTATATERVRQDIVHQLKLNDPEVIVGPYDRPNLIYSVKRAENRFEQITSFLERHPDQSGIIYSIRRKDVDKLCERLTERGYKALPYHAGMADEDRKRNQEDFIQEKVDLIVATVAFGMGIDKSNVRFVIHAGMPKSIEYYQQESGRAGRDGLDAGCMLLYSGADLRTWKYFIDEMEGEVREAALQKLYAMYNYCTGLECRHRALVSYFGQDFNNVPCDACDVCLDKVELAEDALIIGQKILSCVKRLNENFGAGYVSKVLVGSKEQRILQMRHDRLSTYGLLGSRHVSNVVGTHPAGAGSNVAGTQFTQQQVRNWIEQLLGQGFLKQVPCGEFFSLKITEKGWLVLRGEETPKLLKPAPRREVKEKVSRVEIDSWEGVDRDLFVRLRELRLDIARQKKVAAFIIFGDISLRDMARRKPTDLDGFHAVHGVGANKAKEYGRIFTETICEYLEKNPISHEAVLTPVNEKTSQPVRDPLEGIDKILYEKLLELRQSIATQKNIPSFIIFSDALLKDMARLKPGSIDGLIDSCGIDKRKADLYGRVFLKAIREHLGERPGAARYL